MPVMDGLSRSTLLPEMRPVAQIEHFLEANPSRHPLFALFAAAGMALGVAAVILPTLITATAVTPASSATQPVAAKVEKPAKPKPKNPAKISELAPLVKQFTASQTVPFGIYVKNLKNGDQASNLGDRKFTSASLYKLFVALGIFQRIEAGSLSLSSKAPGTKLTIEQCLQIMINISSNQCGHSLGDIVGWGRYDSELSKLGFKSTSLSGSLPVTTANDVGRFFGKLYNGTLMTKASTEKMLTFLKQQRVINRLPQGLPPGTEIAHKTGDLYGYMHDAGIVYGPKSHFIVVALSGPWKTSSDSFTQFAKLSSGLYGKLNP